MSMRTNLIMHFHCAECGSILSLIYPTEETAKPEQYSAAPWRTSNNGAGLDQEPTGAACRYVPAIHVEPCRTCIEKHTGPAKKLAEALKQMGGAA